VFSLGEVARRWRGAGIEEALLITAHASRGRILEAAVKLLEAREYDQIHVREVAEAAGVALAKLHRFVRWCESERLALSLVQAIPGC
jgi:hypothetical protein